jgi:phage/plasmid-like protein (TIGR03299 family)
MSHQLAFDVLSGEYACFVVGEAWHGLNQTAEKPVTWEEARKLAHLTFTVSKRQLVHPNFPDKLIDAFGIFRDDTQEFLATVGGVYTPMQFDRAFSFVDALMGEAGGSHYESAGALGRGNRYWVLARVPKADFSITGTSDVNQGYLLFTSSHDGSLSTEPRLTHVRVVCQNTLNLALKESTGGFFKIKHTTNGEKRLEAAKDIISGVIADSRDLEYKFNLLAKRNMTKESFTSVLDRIFTGKEGTRRDSTLKIVTELFEKNDDNEIPQIRGSAYNLLNAITNFVDHQKGVRITKSKKGITETMARAESAIFGSGNDLKAFALSVIMEETENNPPLRIAA